MKSSPPIGHPNRILESNPPKPLSPEEWQKACNKAELRTKQSNDRHAQELLRAIDAFERFVRSGFQQDTFPKQVYRLCSYTFNHIAHFDRYGFYEVWFSDTDRQIDFVKHALEFDMESSGFLRPVHEAILEVLSESGIYATLTKQRMQETVHREKAELTRLLGKYGDPR